MLVAGCVVSSASEVLGYQLDMFETNPPHAVTNSIVFYEGTLDSSKRHWYTPVKDTLSCYKRCLSLRVSTLSVNGASYSSIDKKCYCHEGAALYKPKDGFISYKFNDNYYAQPEVVEASEPHTEFDLRQYNDAFHFGACLYSLSRKDLYMMDEEAPYAWFTLDFGRLMLVWEYVVSLSFSDMYSVLSYRYALDRDMIVYKEGGRMKVFALEYKDTNPVRQHIQLDPFYASHVRVHILAASSPTTTFNVAFRTYKSSRNMIAESNIASMSYEDVPPVDISINLTTRHVVTAVVYVAMSSLPSARIKQFCLKYSAPDGLRNYNDDYTDASRPTVSDVSQ